MNCFKSPGSRDSVSILSDWQACLACSVNCLVLGSMRVAKMASASSYNVIGLTDILLIITSLVLISCKALVEAGPNSALSNLRFLLHLFDPEFNLFVSDELWVVENVVAVQVCYPALFLDLAQIFKLFDCRLLLQCLVIAFDVLS
jgi:hypothetical protein